MLERYSGWLLAGIVAVITLLRASYVATNGLDLYVDEAQYWYWAQDLAWGYYSKPPMIATLITLTTGVCGDSEFCIRSGSLIFYPLSTVILYFITQRLFNKTIALIAGILFITLPAVSLSSTLISTDVALFFYWTLALFGFVRALDSNAWVDWLIVGIAIGLGLLSKYTMGIFMLSAVVYVVWSKQFTLLLNPRAWFSILLAAALFAPNLWWNYQHNFPTFQHTAEIAANNTGGRWHWDEFGKFLGGQFVVFGIMLFPLLLWLIAKVQLPHKKLLVSFTLPFLTIISLQALFGRANANWAAPTYVAATIMVAFWLNQYRTWLGVALGVNMALGLVVYYPAPLNMILNKDIQQRVKGWNELGEQYKILQAQYPNAALLAKDRALLSELAYYARPMGLQSVSWNPQHAVRHHYDLVTTLDDKEGRDFLYVTPTKRVSADMASYFQQVASVGELEVTVNSAHVLRYNVFLLTHFKGIQP